MELHVYAVEILLNNDQTYVLFTSTVGWEEYNIDSLSQLQGGSFRGHPWPSEVDLMLVNSNLLF
jgi:hypothetical protein